MKTAIVLCLAAGCASEPPPQASPPGGQSYPEAVRILCDVDRLAGGDAEDPLGAEAKRTEYLVEHVKNEDGIYLLTLFRTSEPKRQLSLLGEATESTKISSCPLLAALRATVLSDVSPQP